MTRHTGIRVLDAGRLTKDTGSDHQRADEKRDPSAS